MHFRAGGVCSDCIEHPPQRQTLGNEYLNEWLQNKWRNEAELARSLEARPDLAQPRRGGCSAPGVLHKAWTQGEGHGEARSTGSRREGGPGAQVGVTAERMAKAHAPGGLAREGLLIPLGPNALTSA